VLKKERDKLIPLFEKMLPTLERPHTLKEQAEFRYEGELLTPLNGRVTFTLYVGKTHNQSTWLACQLKDWPVDSSGYSAQKVWHGFGHWKQNLYIPSNITAAEYAVEMLRQHLLKFCKTE
jgi:hypothetical protein